MRRSHLAAEGYGMPNNQNYQQNNYQQNNYQQNQRSTSSQLIDEENEQMASLLSDKVKTLKSLSIDIGNEVREQNKFLHDLDDDFDKSGGFLKSTMSRVTALAKSGNYCHLFYLILFALFVFFVCWLIIKTR